MRRCTPSKAISGSRRPNATAPAPEVGHEVKLINFDQHGNDAVALKVQEFARNITGDQAFISPEHPSGFNRPTMVRFGPDDCAYIADYGAVRDNGADTHYVGVDNDKWACEVGLAPALTLLADHAHDIGAGSPAGIGRGAAGEGRGSWTPRRVALRRGQHRARMSRIASGGGRDVERI